MVCGSAPAAPPRPAWRGWSHRRAPQRPLAGTWLPAAWAAALAPRAPRRAAGEEADLEEELRLAVEAEDFQEAARLRDLLRLRSFDSEAALLSANGEFYSAFRWAAASRIRSKGCPIGL